MPKNFYLILGVPSDATLDEIKTAFRRRALELHPDVSGLHSALGYKSPVDFENQLN